MDRRRHSGVCRTSGFTKLSESLAKKGRVGAEQVADSIGGVFESMLSVAYASGGSLLKFGGDALLLWFDGEQHAARACRAAVLMRDALAAVGRIDVPDGTVALRMSQGVHSGKFDFFAVGTSHRELLPVGPAWSRLVAIQHCAEPDEIAVSTETAAAVPEECLGDTAFRTVARCGAAGLLRGSRRCARVRKFRRRRWRAVCRRRFASTS